MPTESINTDVFMMVIGALPILLSILYLDRQLSRRRRLASNAEYVARIQASRENSELHQVGHGNPVNRRGAVPDLSDLNYEPFVELSAPGFFSRRRIINDRFGRVVATHYEEFVVADRFRDIGAAGIPMAGRPLLMLATGEV